MSMLLFYVGKNRYVIETSYIQYVVPKVPLTSSAHPISYLAGLLNYGGEMIPVIDFCQLIEQRPATYSLHSRILLLRASEVRSNGCPMIGLIAEKIVERLNLELDAFHEASYHHHHLRFLDRVYNDSDGVIHHLNLKIFLEEVKIDLF